MSEVLPVLHAFLRMLHIILGFVGLTLFWLIIAASKGSGWHVRLGTLFTRVTWVITGTALISSMWALVHPESFIPIDGQATDKATLRESYRFVFAILMYLSAATLSGAMFGLQVIRKRNRPDELWATLLPMWLAVTTACSIWLTIFGIWGLVVTKHYATGIPWEAYLIPVCVGGFGVVSAMREWRSLLGPSPNDRSWLSLHVWYMCGTGVAFHTAFIVFGANRLFGFRLPGAWTLLPWIAPPAIGLFLTARYVRKLSAQTAGPLLPPIDPAVAETVAVARQ